MSSPLNPKAEWLEADGLGGFASGTVSGIRTRRYHALLLTATTPPTGRVVLVNGFDAWIETDRTTIALSSQRYAPDVVHPDGAQRIESFAPEPWPHWTFRLEDGVTIEQELFVPQETSAVVLLWRLSHRRKGMRLIVRPFLSGRDYHALHHENPVFKFDTQQRHEQVTWRPYDGLPGVVAVSNGDYVHQPVWYRNFLYEEERNRGLDCVEDLASPGIFRWDLSEGEAVWMLAAEGCETAICPSGVSVEAAVTSLRRAETRRRGRFTPYHVEAPPVRAGRNGGQPEGNLRRPRLSGRGTGFTSRLPRAADAYLVRRGEGKTIIAGYPWFTDWGRDAFIALRGLCLATGRLQEARDILLSWAGMVSEGMLPNRFPDRGEAPEFNSVDASLWYIIAAYEWFQAMKARRKTLTQSDQQIVWGAIDAILSGYVRGTRYGIHIDDDGLLAAGQRGLALTWMDARIGDWVVTPRIGKPVEVNALWLNALWIAGSRSPLWKRLCARGLDSFWRRFWNESGGFLYDVIDCEHRPGATDDSVRPNQIFAVGGLPIALLDGEQARRVVETIEARLLTPMGLRSLAPGEPGYAPRYDGGVRERDAAYHQGTVWPWLMGPFVEAWVRVHGGTPAAKQQAREQFLTPLLSHLDDAGLGHLCEIADAEPPHTPRGCPFQAWSVAEALRLDLIVLADSNARSQRQVRAPLQATTLHAS